MLEFYQAYANYHDLMNLTEELIKFIAMEVNGSLITHFNGNEINLGKWTKLSMIDATIKWWSFKFGKFGPAPEYSDFQSAAGFQAFCDRTAENIEKLRQPDEVTGRPSWTQPEDVKTERRIAKVFFNILSKQTQLTDNPGKSIADLFEAVAEEHLIQPTIIYDFPLSVSPLSKIKPSEPDWVERFEFYIGGFECGNAFSELNDPEDQHNRFKQQLERKEQGDDEAHQMDEDYVRALGYGLPPTAGEGIGIDRLTMLLTNSRSIRDVILFPLMRPQQKTTDQLAAKEDQPHGESAE
jgi:lysyl-tRNA synthetase class 2